MKGSASEWVGGHANRESALNHRLAPRTTESWRHPAVLARRGLAAGARLPTARTAFVTGAQLPPLAAQQFSVR